MPACLPAPNHAASTRRYRYRTTSGTERLPRENIANHKTRDQILRSNSARQRLARCPSRRVGSRQHGPIATTTPRPARPTRDTMIGHYRGATHGVQSVQSGLRHTTSRRVQAAEPLALRGEAEPQSVAGRESRRRSNGTRREGQKAEGRRQSREPGDDALLLPELKARPE